MSWFEPLGRFGQDDRGLNLQAKGAVNELKCMSSLIAQHEDEWGDAEFTELLDCSTRLGWFEHNCSSRCLESESHF